MKKIVLLIMISVYSSTTFAQNDFHESTQKTINSIKEVNQEADSRTLSKISKTQVESTFDQNISAEDMYKTINDGRPRIGKTNVVFVGDRMVQKRTGYYADCVIPKKESSKRVTGWTYIIKADVPICRESAKSKKIIPNYVNATSSARSTVKSVKIKSKKGKHSICIKDTGVSIHCQKNLTDGVDVLIGPAFISVENGMQQTIEYMGKSGDTVKFTYSETSNNIARLAFTRDFEVDMTEDRMAGFKGAIFEVIEASNMQITYKMHRHFK